MHTPSGQLPVVKLWNHSKHSIRKAPRLAELAGKWLQSLGVLPFLSPVQLVRPVYEQRKPSGPQRTVLLPRDHCMFSLTPRTKEYFFTLFSPYACRTHPTSRQPNLILATCVTTSEAIRYRLG